MCLVIFYILFYHNKKFERCGGYKLNKKDVKTSYKIVTSCTTSPTRISKMKETFSTLKKQTVSPNYMFLNLPYVYGRTNETYNIPEYILKDESIVINRLDMDYGPSTKLVGAILAIPKDQNTWIIVHDDDQLYLQNTVETYVDYINKYSSNKIAFTIAGFNFSNDMKTIKNFEGNLVKVQIAEGYCTFCVHRSVFEDNFIPYIINTNKNKDCKLSDDLIISNYLSYKNIDILQISQNDISKELWWKLGCELEYGNKGDALKNSDKSDDKLLGGHFPKYVRAVEYLKSQNLYFIK
jgi:hypothetical protein